MTSLTQTIQPPAAGDITPITEIQQKLDEVRERYSEVPDFNSKEGYQAGKKAIQEMTKLRTGTDKARKAITKPHRDFTDQVNGLAKSLIGEVEALEQPFRDAKAEVDERAEREKEARIKELREKLHREVTALLDTATTLTHSAELRQLLEMAEAVESKGWYEITQEAEDERARVINILRDKVRFAEDEERLAAQREEIERQKAELAQQQAALQQPAESQAPAEPSVVDANVTQPMSGCEANVGEAASAALAFDEMSPWDEALEDLIGLGIDVSAAECVLDAISNGDVRHVSLSQ